LQSQSIIESGRYSRTIKPIYLTGDLICLNIAYLIAFVIRFKSMGITHFDNTNFWLLLITNFSWVMISINLRLYRIQRTANIQDVFWDLFRGLFMLFLVVATSIFIFRFTIISRFVVITFFILLTISLLSWRFIFLRFLKAYRKAGYNYTRVIIVGAGKLGQQLRDSLLRQPEFGFKFLGFFDDKQLKSNKLAIKGKIQDVYQFVTENNVDEIYVALPESAVEHTRELISFAENNLIKINIVPDFRKFINRAVQIEMYNHIPLISIRREPLLRMTNRVIKRGFDIFFALLIIVLVLSWLLPILALLVRLESRGSVFFKQERNGEGNKVFSVIKMRSMRINKDANQRQAVRNDPRITKLGHFMRKTNLDELPQFFNVLKGDMSVIGPRPHMLKHTIEYSLLIDKYLLRQSIKPGITGWAQVMGYRGETTDPELMKMRVLYDVWYMENWSFLLDMKIIYLTIANMVKGDKNAG